jgi:hypothetical protein
MKPHPVVRFDPSARDRGEDMSLAFALEAPTIAGWLSEECGGA